MEYFGEFDIGETAASIREMKLGNKKKNPSELWRVKIEDAA